MLIELSVANYRCFRERVTLSMEAEPRISERDKSVDERNLVDRPEGTLLRVVGVYGANASGKSNLLGAMKTLRRLVLDSAREGQAGDRLPIDPFRLDAESRNAPSELEAVFSRDGAQYRYGIEATPDRVEREWLLTWTPGDDDERLLFSREGDRYETGEGWRHDPSLEKKTRAEALHVSVAAAFNHPQAMTVLHWFRRLRIIDSASENKDSSTTAALLGHSMYENRIRRFIAGLDFGIDELRVREWDTSAFDRLYPGFPGLDQPKAVQLENLGKLLGRATREVVVVRSGMEFDLRRDESAGTVKAIELAGPLIEALTHGYVVVIDELDSRLHTLLAKKIVELFQDPEVNHRDSQLVFASHDTNLLTRALLRRDQLWFVEKSRKTQASDLYSLAELRLETGKGVRNDARYEADYLQGKYGAIPFFGSLEAMLSDPVEDEDED